MKEPERLLSIGPGENNKMYGFTTIYWRDMIRFVRFKTLLVSSLLQPPP